MRRFLSLASVLVLATLSACGDDNPSGYPSGSGFAKEANADCKTANATLTIAAAPRASIATAAKQLGIPDCANPPLPGS